MSNVKEYKDIVAFHPGYYIADIIDDMEISQNEFATRMGTTAKTLSKLINGQANISNDLAKKLSVMLGTSVEVWQNLQNTYDQKLIDNPAGFASCLCAGFPFLILLLSSKNKYVRYGGWLAGTIIVTTIILSYSRAGIVSVTILSCLYLYERLEWKKVLKYLLLASLVLLLFGCYWMKKDSADGRLLIWKCCINMVKDAPWTGHGIGSFEAHYMDYQADYFKQHEQSRYSMLADNVKQPFNEYLKILLNFGIVGILVLFLLIGAIVYCYKKNSNTEKKIGFYSLISIGTFSLFSYPFTYPFVWAIAF